jgi:ABC-2 type transport system ATP-binding protein
MGNSETGLPPAISIRGVSKQYKEGLFKKSRKSLDDVSFDVERGRIFGFIGHNGAGKTTCIKIILGLAKPSAGKVMVLGRDVAVEDVRGLIGYLPESPYYYGHLRALEFLEVAGRLCGLGGSESAGRAREMLRAAGLENVADVPLSRFSKGMLQRIGIAQSLVGDPEILIYDEPMSGLDPTGRREIRDIMTGLRERGKTVFFSTHILSDAEMICDSVGILVNGRLRASGKLEELLKPRVNSYEIAVKGPSEKLAGLMQAHPSAVVTGNALYVSAPDENEARGILRHAFDEGCTLISYVEKRERLEDLYLSELKGEQSHG